MKIEEISKFVTPIKDGIWCHLVNKKVIIDEKTSGKWLIFNDLGYLKEIADKLLSSMISGKIGYIKWSHREGNDQFKDKTPVMCVFSDDKHKEEVWKILEKIGIKQRIWKYDFQTYEDWKKGGRLYNEWNK